MAIAKVTGQNVSNQGVNVITLALALPGNATPGNVVVITVGCKNKGLADPTFSGLGVSSFVKLQTITGAGTNSGTCWIFAGAVTSAATTVTMSCSSAVIGATMVEFSGVATALTQDGTGSTGSHAQASSPVPATGAFSTSNANDLIIAVADWVGVNTISVSPVGYTTETIWQTTGSNSNTGEMAWQIVSSTGSQSATWVLSTAQAPWVAAICALPAASGGTVYNESVTVATSAQAMSSTVTDTMAPSVTMHTSGQAMTTSAIGTFNKSVTIPTSAQAMTAIAHTIMSATVTIPTSAQTITVTPNNVIAKSVTIGTVGQTMTVSVNITFNLSLTIGTSAQAMTATLAAIMNPAVTIGTVAQTMTATTGTVYNISVTIPTSGQDISVAGLLDMFESVTMALSAEDISATYTYTPAGGNNDAIVIWRLRHGY